MSIFPCSTTSATKKNLISIEGDCCRFTVLFAMPITVELLQCTSMGGCGCPISSRVSQNSISCLQLRKRAPSSASAAAVTTNHKIVQSVKNAPFNLMGFVRFAFHPMKNGHMLDCVHLLWRGMTHPSGRLISCQRCGILLSRRDVLPSNP